VKLLTSLRPIAQLLQLLPSPLFAYPRVYSSSQGAPAYEKSEDPVWVLEHNLPIDTEYYLTNQLSNPLQRIFEPIIPNPQTLISGDHTRTVSERVWVLLLLLFFCCSRAVWSGCERGVLLRASAQFRIAGLSLRVASSWVYFQLSCVVPSTLETRPLCVQYFRTVLYCTLTAISTV
jgi:hypothetical protein